MEQHTLPINEILVEDRQRQDLGDIEGLKSSIQTYGLIQPIVLACGPPIRLIAGGRRLEACKRLGWTHIPVCYRETLTEEELTCVELEENIQRKEMTWKENVATVYKIHKLKAKTAPPDGDAWTQEHTGRMLGVSRASVGFTITIAKELLNQGSKIHDCATYTEALRWCFQRREDEIQSELAKRLQGQLAVNQQVARIALSTIPIVSATGENLLIEPVPHETPTNHLVIDLMNTIVNAESIAWMTARSTASIDHIITDPPYAVDLIHFEQNNPHGGMANIDRIEETHQVEDNLKLLHHFLFEAERVLKPNGFCIFFLDIMHWQKLYDRAIAVGFRVQRWPFVWHKTHQCMNQRAEFNFTKNVEFAMICRKPSSVLVKPVQTTLFSCPSTGYVSNPFAKPADLWTFLINAVSIQGQTILDPFAGEGSCPEAIMSSWRFPIGVEIDTKHFNVMFDSVRSKYNTFYRNPTLV